MWHVQKWTYKGLSRGTEVLISTTQQIERQSVDVVADDDVHRGYASMSAATYAVTKLST